ncbi:MAG: MBL fold metallo-hydrolase [Anaerolineales bacterium]|nr:MBL fold metallo-hydrolase [Anaerolineales bacterium]
MLEIERFILGPIQTNSYLIADPSAQKTVVIDPAWEGSQIVKEARKRGWTMTAIWLTHAHFDHIGGVAGVVDEIPPGKRGSLPIGLHQEDMEIWKNKGGAPMFGMELDPGPQPNLLFEHGQSLSLGSLRFEVRFAPGHTPGHVMFYCSEEEVLFSGDVLFQGGIGRTDLPGGNHRNLLHSIQTQVLSLPDSTRVYSGHGPPTTVGRERERNPFL